MTDVDGPVVRSWARLAISSLVAAQPELDRTNVFPVADGDTGTNLRLTFGEGVRAVEALGADADGPAVLAALADGCRQGARGNSGVLTAEWVRALAGAWHEGAARALAAAATAAYDAAGEPVEGTLLTVARAAADAAGAVGDGSRSEEQPGWAASALAVAAVAARDALSRTPDLLPALGGELDAGAHGLVLVIESLARASGAEVGIAVGVVHDGVPAVSPAHGTMAAVELTMPVPASRAPAVPVTHPPGDVEVVLDVVLHQAGGSGTLARDLRDALREVGGSVAVAGGDGAWRAHVHTDDPARAVRTVDAVVARVAGASDGAVRDVQVRHLVPRTDAEGPGVVVLSSAPGLLADLARAGAVVLLVDERHAAGEAAVRRATEETGAAVVEVLRAPDSDLRLVAGLVALATAGPELGPQQRVEVLRAAVERLDVAVLAPGELADPGAAAGARPRSGEDVVLVLHGDRVSPHELDDLASALGEARTGTEIVVLASGRDDDLVELGWGR